ncbi:hypothetical protein MVI01_68440 [Myxococcus virescens]|uniref:Uncharacterized protein n=1 Tax=Myxococcus virescens TaxID=83456 RepID=A0A511HNA1_9BACT|nr:hypothetical protein MVI01_68440 [Myxococcus virescens]
MRKHVAKLLAEASKVELRIPQYLEPTVTRHLECRVLEHGFVAMRLAALPLPCTARWSGC